MIDLLRRAQGDVLGAFGLNPDECSYSVIASGAYWHLRDYAGCDAFFPFLLWRRPSSAPTFGILRYDERGAFCMEQSPLWALGGPFSLLRKKSILHVRLRFPRWTFRIAVVEMERQNCVRWRGRFRISVRLRKLDRLEIDLRTRASMCETSLRARRDRHEIAGRSWSNLRLSIFA